MTSIRYYNRIFQAYLGRGQSQLSFWHGEPALNEQAFAEPGRRYYMKFAAKSEYSGPFDDDGVPLLDYRGAIGRRYNPIAIAQYGLGCLNAYRETGNIAFRERSLKAADWLVANLAENDHGLSVWMHDFDWEYFRLLKAPWYSGLAQGQCISLLLRAHLESKTEKYAQAAAEAFKALITPIDEGGVLFVDGNGDWWIEEYITDPPTHILNGFIWALWGAYDFSHLPVSDWGVGKKAGELWERGITTLQKNLGSFDAGCWSLYDLAPVKMKNPASAFYHKLHIVQLDVMERLSGKDFFGFHRKRWERYQARTLCRHHALILKVLFKLAYY